MDVHSCKLVCKEWKNWMEIAFDHSYDDYLPLVYNCEKENTQEVDRLLRIIPQSEEFFIFKRSLFCTPHLEVIKFLLQDNRVDPTALNNWSMYSM
jgi:hypothetical protein